MIFQSLDKLMKSGDSETEKKHKIDNIDPIKVVMIKIILLSNLSDK